MRTGQRMVNEDLDRAKFKLSLFPFFCPFPVLVPLFPCPLFNVSEFDTF